MFELNDQSEDDENMIKFYTLILNNLIVLMFVYLCLCVWCYMVVLERGVRCSRIFLRL